MTGWWLASYVVLWVVVLGVLVVMLVVLRQLGLIYLGTRGAGIRIDEGPGEGAVLRDFVETDAKTGREVRFPDPDTALNLLLLVSPGCPICKEALSGLRRATNRLDVGTLVVSAGEPEHNRELERAVEPPAAFATSLERQRQLGIFTIPFGVVTNSTGVVLSRGAVNSIVDLEDLIEEARSRVADAPEAIPV